MFHCFHFKFIPNFKNMFILFPSKHSPWWRRLEDVFRLLLQKTSSTRPLDQHQNIRLGHTSSRRLQNIFKTSSRPRLQGARYLEDVFKTSSRHLAKLSSRHLQDVFNVYHQVKLFLLTRLQDVILRRWRTAKMIRQKKLPRSYFWEICGQCTKFPRVNSLDMPKRLKSLF